MELSATDAAPNHQNGRRNKFKLSSFPDYVRRVQQRTCSHSVSSANRGQVPLQPTRGKKQNFSRALSCFETSSNSPVLTRPPARPRAATLPPLNGTIDKGFGRNNKPSKTRPHNDFLFTSSSPSDHQSLHRASSFPQIDPKPATSQEQKAKHKSPYLQPLVRKPYYRKQAALTDNKGPKTSRKLQVRDKADSRTRSHTIHEISPEKQSGMDKSITTLSMDKLTATTTLTIPSITLRAATPSASESDLSTSLLDQFTARSQLAAELEKLNREVHDIVVCVEKV